MDRTLFVLSALALLIITICIILTYHIAHPSIPQHVMVNGFEWDIKLVSEIDKPKCGCHIYGQTEFDYRFIQIRKGQNLPEEQDTLLHELEHAAMGEPFSREDITGHGAIKKLTPEILAILSNNPELVRYLTRKE